MDLGKKLSAVRIDAVAAPIGLVRLWRFTSGGDTTPFGIVHDSLSSSPWSVEGPQLHIREVTEVDDVKPQHQRNSDLRTGNLLDRFCAPEYQ